MQRWHCLRSLHACIGQLVVTVSPQPPDRGRKRLLVHASCVFFPIQWLPHRRQTHRSRVPTVQPACPCLCDLTVAQVRSLKITFNKKKRTQQFTLRSRFAIGGNLLNRKLHMHYSEINSVHRLLWAPLLFRRAAWTACLLWPLSNCRRSGSPDYPSLPAFLATGRPFTWGS